MRERLQKVLAKAGYGSRRTCEAMIEEGRVWVNGVPAHLGDSADPDFDSIELNGERVTGVNAPRIYIALNKPRGVLSDVDSKDPRKNIKELVPEDAHLFAVGRLDFDSEGLILLTNDGELANHLTHPRYEHEKEYEVLVTREPDGAQLATWRRGVVLRDGYKTLPAVVSVLRKAEKGVWMKVILREGKKRQIREVGALLGLPVARLIRVRLAGLQLGNLKTGEYRYLSPDEIAVLKKQGQKPERKKPERLKKSGYEKRRKYTSKRKTGS